MGFALWPEAPKDGVWILKKTGALIIVDGPRHLFARNVWYKSRQKIPRVMMDATLITYFEYLGEL
jgi:hypothetical protein